MNGESVMGHKHSEVVEMIRDSSYVTLTLLGRHLSNGTAKGVCTHGRLVLTKLINLSDFGGQRVIVVCAL